MQKSKPDHAPLLAGDAICHTCGKILKPKPIKGRGGVQAVFYECVNPEFGCSYRVQNTQYMNGEIEGIRPDGKTA